MKLCLWQHNDALSYFNINFFKVSKTGNTAARWHFAYFVPVTSNILWTGEPTFTRLDQQPGGNKSLRSVARSHSVPRFSENICGGWVVPIEYGLYMGEHLLGLNYFLGPLNRATCLNILRCVFHDILQEVLLNARLFHSWTWGNEPSDVEIV